MVEMLVASPVTRAVGLALVHFIWQGFLIAGAAAGLFHVLRRAGAAHRYAVGCVALLLMAAAPIVTAVRVASTTQPLPVSLSEAAGAPQPAAVPRVSAFPGVAPESTASLASSPAANHDRYASVLPAIAIIWAIGVVMLAARLTAAWLRARQVRRAASPVGDPWRRRLDGIAERLGLTRPIALAESAAIDVPTLVGWIRPAILMPASVLTGLTPAQLDAILTHELAHVRRHDYLVNIFQSAIETLLFYHPAVWWVSHRVRLEREMCCDDLVVAIVADRVVYARALASLEELRGERALLGVAATGGHLLERVRRILAPEPLDQRRSPAWSALTAIIALAPVVLIAAAAPSTSLRQDGTAVGEAVAMLPPATGQVRVSPAGGQSLAPSPRATVPAKPSVVAAAQPANAPPQLAASATATADEQAVLALEEQFRLAKVQNDVKALERLLDDGVVSTNQVGRVRRKADLLELWQTFRVEWLTLDSADVHITGDLATVIGRQTEISGTSDYPMLFTRVWRRAGSTWRLVSVTQFRDPDPPPAPAVQRTTQVFRLEYELFRDNALLGRPTAIVTSGRAWSIQIPGEPAVSALVSAAGDDAVTLNFTPGPAGGPSGSFVLRGPEPAEVSWSAGARTYRLRIRNLTPLFAVMDALQSARDGTPGRPVKIKDVPPVYPPEAKSAKVAGTVILEMVVDEQGDVSDVKVVRSVPMLDAAAVDAVRQWKYQPTPMGGKPVKVMMTTNVTFKLN